MIGLIWAGCFVLLLVVYMLVLSPQGKTKRSIAAELAEKKQMYESALQASQEKTKIQQAEQIERLQNRLKDFVIDYENSANLSFDISQIATEKNVDGLRIKDSKKTKRRNSKSTDCEYIGENYYNIGFKADFNQFATLLNRLERHRPVIFVDKFSITRSDEEDGNHAADMELAVFVRKRQES
jgi:hypothetical protein